MILQRIEGQRFSRVLRLWRGYPVVLLGGGPSLTLEQFARVRAAREADAVRVIAVNDAYLLAPWADVHYAADSKWHTWHATGIDKQKLGLTAAQVRERWAQFKGQKCGIESAAPYLADDVHMLRTTNGLGLSVDPEILGTGRLDGFQGHGGFQAFNLARLADGKTIILLGFDGRPNPAGETNFHGEHPLPTPSVVWGYIRQSFSCVENELKAAGVRVLNCSPGSAIDTFPKVALEEALAGLDSIALYSCGRGCAHHDEADALRCASA